MGREERQLFAPRNVTAHYVPLRMSDRWLWLFILLGTVFSLLVSYQIATQSLILGSLPGGWTYRYAARFTSQPIGAALLVGGISVALLLLTRGIARAGRLRQWLIVAVWIVAATPLQAVMRSLTAVDFETIFVSEAANSFYSVTREYGARKVLAEFNELRETWPWHAQSNMPGKLMLLYALQLISKSPVVLPWIIVVISNLGGALIYIFTRDLLGDCRVALFSLALYLFVPAKLFFFPLMNTVTPILAVGCAWLLLKMLQKRQRRYAALLGVAVYGIVFFEPLALVMGLLFAGFIARALWLGAISRAELWAQLGVGFVAFATTYAAMYLWFGFELVAALRRVAMHAVEFNVQNARPYGVWVEANLREFVVGMGVCQAFAFGAAVLDGLRGPGEWQARLTRPVTVLCLGLLAVVAVTDLMGVNRGEVIRLWIFLACMFQIPTAYVCASFEGNSAIVLVLACTVLQAALGATLIGFIVTG
jgi:hypothetical protein